MIRGRTTSCSKCKRGGLAEKRLGTARAVLGLELVFRVVEVPFPVPQEVSIANQHCEGPRVLQEGDCGQRQGGLLQHCARAILVSQDEQRWGDDLGALQTQGWAVSITRQFGDLSHFCFFRCSALGTVSKRHMCEEKGRKQDKRCGEEVVPGAKDQNHVLTS